MATTQPTRRHAAPPRRPRSRKVMVAAIALLGIATLIYPSAARWFTDRQHATGISGYADDVSQLPSDEQRQILARAHAYNDGLPRGPLRVAALPGQPRDDSPITSPVSDMTRSGTYGGQLAVPGTDVIATVTMPSIGVTLPVRHGVDEHTLSRGVGHLPGSSLPVGGQGTHAVLTGHSGLVDAAMFDALKDIEVGDIVDVVVLDTTMRYEIDDLRTVTPNDTSSLQLEDGQDSLTLVTCTPIGANSHRLLVSGHRIDDSGDASGRTVAAGSATPAFPWWAVVLGAGVAGFAFTVLTPRRAPSVTQTAPQSAGLGGAAAQD